MGSYSYRKHKKSKHSKKSKHHMRRKMRKTRKMGGGSTACGIPGCRSDATTASGTHMLHTPLAVGGQNGGGGGQVCSQNPYQFQQAGGRKGMKKQRFLVTLKHLPTSPKFLNRPPVCSLRG